MFVRKSRGTALSVCAVLVVVIAGIATWSAVGRSAPPAVPFSTLLQHIERRDIARMAADGDRVAFTLVGGESYRTVAPANFFSLNAALVTDLAKNQVSIDVRESSDALPVVPLLITFALLASGAILMHRFGTGRLLGLGDAQREATRDQKTVTFADVAGVDEAKEELAELVEFLRAPQRFAAIGGRIPKGVLLVGPPGTGKTLLARSIAGEAQVPFLFASGSDFVEMYAGVGARRIRKLFRDAGRHEACIIFIDELDAVGRSRGGASLSHEEREQTLNQLLVEMDGFAPQRGVVVIAATNRPDILDAALLRPGRFDRQVTVGAPDLNGREQILRLHARGVSTDVDLDLRSIARGTPGFSGAELANLVNEAALLAVRRGSASVSSADFDQARDKVLMGTERRSLVMSGHERKTCAYHEAGHAVVAACLPHADPLHKVTIVPRGRALGVTMQLPIGDRHTHSRDYLEAQIAILMAGRAAEEIFLQQRTSGARQDIERATDIARRMVCEFGMSETIGPLACAIPQADSDSSTTMSEATAQLVDREVRRFVMAGAEAAHRIVTDHWSAVRALAEALLLEESLDGDEVRAVIAKAMTAATAGLPASDHRATAGNDPDQEQHDRNHEQYMDERADRIGPDDTQKPRDQQNHGDGVQHPVLHPVVLQGTVPQP